MKPLPMKARIFIGLVVSTGLTVVAYGLTHWQSRELPKYLCYLVMALLASQLKVSLPGITGTMSANFLFDLIGVAELGLGETLVMGCLAAVLQCLWKAKQRPQPIQVLFNVANIANAIGIAYFIYHLPLAAKTDCRILLLAAAATAFFLVNTLPVATIVSLTEGKKLVGMWQTCYFWSFPYYLVGAALTALLGVLGHLVRWEAPALVLPIIYWIFRSYRLYLGHLEGEKRHAEETAALHLRTIEALALAIEAKDDTTRRHLHRVQIYAMELAQAMGLRGKELDAVRAAALLHDIGKLAVPEHIISKPGKLTPEEFEKMKVHPTVGAEILERVQFPYPVVPIVLAHHEKWDGTGYPHGVRGRDIPIGARILASVDCLDALASDRQYRRALPLEHAMEIVASEAGKSYDPEVVQVLQQHYLEWERMAQAAGNNAMELSTDVRIEQGVMPAAGFEHADGPSQTESSRTDFLSSIAGARQEAQALFELSQNLGSSLSLSETLSVLAVRLKHIVPFDTIAIYLLRNERLVPEYVNGEDFRLFSSLQIPLGEGLAGWVAANQKPIINGNPSVEPGYLASPSTFSVLRSALAVPLEGLNGVVGVLAVYQTEKDAFTRDHLRILLAVSPKVALSVENALKYELAETSATVDYLTGLPNARSLFLHLDGELNRCKRQNSPLSVLVCDLDGFKQINDRLGHLEGNRVLRLVANGLKGACREYDYAARMGGDEFVVVMPGLRREAVKAMEARFCDLVADIGQQIGVGDSLSLSVGEAHYPEDGVDAEDLLAHADRRMYTVKRQHHTNLLGGVPFLMNPKPATAMIQ